MIILSQQRLDKIYGKSGIGINTFATKKSGLELPVMQLHSVNG